MSYLDISQLELQLDKLLRAYQKLRNENQLLHQKLLHLEQEQAILVDKNQKAVIKIKHVISQIREDSNERVF